MFSLGVFEGIFYVHFIIISTNNIFTYNNYNNK